MKEQMKCWQHSQKERYTCTTELSQNFSRALKQIFCTLICVVLSERERKKPAKSKFLYFFFSNTVIHFSCLCQTFPKSYSPEINRASPFSSLTILMNGKGFKGAIANDNVEWIDHVLPLFQNYLFWQYPNQVSTLLCLKVVFTKAHILRLYGGAQRTVNSGNSLLDFEKAVLVHIRIKGLWLLMWCKPQKLAII